jgi:RsiW-degrading membrane proteinase PrsW (M82 family)
VVVVILSLGALPVVFRRRLSGSGGLPVRVIGLLTLGGGAAGLAASVVERSFFSALGASLVVEPGTTVSAIVLMFLFAAPLEEALKVAVVWPTVRSGRLDERGTGIVFASAVAAGFAAAESAAFIVTGPQDVTTFVRAVLGLPAHFFCAALWGYTLGRRASSGGGRWAVPGAWLAAVVVHAVYDHIVFGRGPGIIALAAPILVAMAGLSWAALRDVAPEALPRSRLISSLPEPPSLRVMRRALRRTDQPLMLHWIGIGALVNVGVVLAFLALAVYAGHRLGIDFAGADEADMRANGPIVLLGAAVLAAFPVAGYLVARASGAASVLEPALATGLAIFAVVALLSAMAPIAILFALALAPIAFGLACGGAWFGRSQ